ncbi:MAG: TorF family putative porin, partial [Planctomycetota bacterium]
MQRTMTCVLVGASVLGGAFTGGRALALGDVSCDAEAAFVSRYVWRGIVLTDDPSLQPGFTTTWRGLSFNFWGNMDLGDANENEGEFTEADFTFTYAREFGKVGLSAGVIHYNFPNVGTEEDDTTEFTAKVELDVPASPSIEVWVDINETDGTYARFGLGHELPLLREMKLELSFALGIGSPNNNEA